MDYKAKKEALKNKPKREIKGIVVTDADSQKIAEELEGMKTHLAEMAESFEKGIETFDNTKANELLEENLDRVVELQKEIDGNNTERAKDFEKRIKEIVDKIAAIRPVVNVQEKESKIVNKIIVEDWKKQYMFSDSDKSESTTYVGFVRPDGGWYIERVTKSKTSDKARFIFGDSDYVSNWGSRLQHNYKYLYEAING